MSAVRTLDVRALRPTLDAVGTGRTAALRVVGLSAATLERDLRLPGATTDALWQAAVDHSDADLPLRIAQTVGPSSYGHLTYLLAAAPTVGDALRGLCRHYGPLLGDTTAHHIEPSPHRARLTVASFHPRPACVNLFSVAVIARFVWQHAGVRPRRAFLGPTIAPAQQRTARASLGCPIDTRSSALGLEYEAKDLHVPLRTADPQLQRLLEDHARWRGIAETTMQARVEATIAAQGPTAGLPCSDVAAALGLSVRTLRRRLAAERTSFQSVLDGTLRRAALELLGQRTVDEAASVLGYADGSAFRRAHRRWFGSSPRSLSPAASRSR